MKLLLEREHRDPGPSDLPGIMLLVYEAKVRTANASAPAPPKFARVLASFPQRLDEALTFLNAGI